MYSNIRNKPLLRRDGDRVFKTGTEASQLLDMESHRKDYGKPLFLECYGSMVESLSPVFDRVPKYAWIMKLLLEPERSIIFRVAWLDDTGVSRVNRGFRIQYSSALGPYEGGTSFHPLLGLGVMKAHAFESTFSNALVGLSTSDGLTADSFGGAYGGADFNPYNKSENEIQRFCQSYMTELSKYIGHEVDLPGMGDGCTPVEIGYMYGQYKRINEHYGRVGRGLLWGGTPRQMQATGFGIVYFANTMLKDKGLDLKGKRCIITGSNYIAMAVGEKILELGGVPITMSDSFGHVYEPDGIDASKMKAIKKVKAERGTRIGRYIISSTTAKYNEYESVFDIPCDYVFNCSRVNVMTADNVSTLSENGCKMIAEGAMATTDPAAIKKAQKKGILLAPYKAAGCAGAMVNGIAIEDKILSPLNEIELEQKMEAIYHNIKATATEFNKRGDFHAGANIAAFLRVADAMLAHGSV